MSAESMMKLVALVKQDPCWVLLVGVGVWYVKQEVANRALINRLLKSIEGRNGGRAR